MSATLVGRGPVLATARAALEEALAGAGQLLLISGEPGIGKSGLASQLAADSAARGARVLSGACWDGGGRGGRRPGAERVLLGRRSPGVLAVAVVAAVGRRTRAGLIGRVDAKTRL